MIDEKAFVQDGSCNKLEGDEANRFMKLDDHLKHIRSSAFAVVLLATTLLVGLDDPTRFSRASEQLENLINALKGWGSYWTIWIAVSEAVGESRTYKELIANHPDYCDYEQHLAIPKHSLLRVQVDQTVEVNHADVSYSIPLHLDLELPTAYVPSILETTREGWLGPAGFRDFWNALQEPLRVVASVDTENPRTSVAVDDSVADLGEDLVKSRLEYKSEYGVNLRGRLHFEEGQRGIIAATSFDRDDLEIEVHIPVVLRDEPEKFYEFFEMFRELGCGIDFDDCFPELSVIADEYPSGVGPDDALSLLRRDLERSPETAKLFGISIPRSRITFSGLLMLLFSTLYLLTLYQNLSAVIGSSSNPPKLLDAALIGMFKGYLSWCLWTAMTVVLPVAAALRLASWATTWECFSWVLAAAVAIVAGWILVERSLLKKLWSASVVDRMQP